MAENEIPFEQARGLTGGDAVDRLLQLELERTTLARLDAAEDVAWNRLGSITESRAVDTGGAPVEASGHQLHSGDRELIPCSRD
jgi:hypothetical protein